MGVTRRLGDIARDLDIALPDMTEEQWREHDARVHASLEALRPRERDHERDLLVSLVDRGWPVRALEVVRGAAFDASAEAVLELRRREEHEDVVVLSGAVGCGKSVAAAWWACERERGAWFMRASTFARTSRYDAQPWRNASALCLDDLGAEYLDAKGSFLVDLDELIDSHYADRRPLLITTNSTWPEFAARYGARIVNRMRECARWVNLKGASRR